MKYMCLIYNSEAVLGYAEELRRKGHLVAAHALQPGQAATTVRVRNGRLSMTEGPGADRNEQLRAVVVLDARDLNEAIQLASRMPEASRGSIEIRPVEEPG